MICEETVIHVIRFCEGFRTTVETIIICKFRFSQKINTILEVHLYIPNHDEVNYDNA